MKLSAPVYFLKRKAKEASRAQGIPFAKALDVVARDEGFSSWSLLAARLASTSPAKKLLESLDPGDLILVGARPGHGKTSLSLALVVAAIDAGYSGYFFTLEWNVVDVVRQLSAMDRNLKALDGRFRFDNSDEISAAYVIDCLKAASPGAVVAIDYLQLLDQRRSNPDLDTQLGMLSTFARQRKLIMVLISQIDRKFELSGKSCPGIEDVRFANPMDLSVFDKSCFLNDGELRISNVTQDVTMYDF